MNWFPFQNAFMWMLMKCPTISRFKKKQWAQPAHSVEPETDIINNNTNSKKNRQNAWFSIWLSGASRSLLFYEPKGLNIGLPVSFKNNMFPCEFLSSSKTSLNVFAARITGEFSSEEIILWLPAFFEVGMIRSPSISETLASEQSETCKLIDFDKAKECCKSLASLQRKV